MSKKLDIFIYIIYTVYKECYMSDNNVVTSDKPAQRGPQKNNKFGRNKKGGNKNIPNSPKRIIRPQKKG